MNGYDVKLALAEHAKLVRAVSVVTKSEDTELAGFLEYLADTVDMNAKVLGPAAHGAALKEVLLNTLDFERDWRSADVIADATAFVEKLRFED